MSGGTPSTSTEAFWGGDIPWMSSKSLTDFRVRDSGRRLTPLGVENGSKLVPSGTILMVVRGMSLKSEFRMGITQREVALSQDLKGLVPRPDLDPAFLAYALQSRAEEVLDMVDEAGHGTGRLQTDRLFALKLLVPPRPVQEKIAATLSLIDDMIESNRRASSIASALLDSFATAAGPELPTAPLRDLVSSQKESVNPAKLGDQQVDHYSLPAFDGGAVPERVAASAILSNKLRVASRSILLSRLNPRFNRTWWVAPHAVPALASTEFLVLTAASDQDLAAAWLAIRDDYFMSELARRVTGTSGSHQRVRPDDILAIEVPNFSRASDDLKKAALALLERIEQLRTEVGALTSLRNALLPELLSGRVRVPIAEGAA